MHMLDRLLTTADNHEFEFEGQRPLKLGPAWLWLAGPVEKNAGNIFRPRSSKDNNRYNEKNGVNKRAHELAFGIVGSKGGGSAAGWRALAVT